METQNYPVDKSSKLLFKAGGWTSVLFLVYSFITILILALIDGNYPDSAEECFEMIHANRFIALIRLDLTSIIVIPFYYLLFFSIYHLLKKGHELIAQIALFLTLAGVTVFISGLNLASILHLSDKFYQTTSHEEKERLLAACEGMLAEDMWINTGAIIRGILIESGSVIFCIIMLKTNVFNKATGWIGLLTHSLDLLSIIFGLFFYTPVKQLFTILAGPLYFIWFILIGLRLFQLGKI